LTITDRPEDSLAEHGLRVVGRVLPNPTTSQLYAAALERREGVIAENGPLVVDTGRFTGRSPKDKFLVEEASSRDRIWWGEVNQPLAEERVEQLGRDPHQKAGTLSGGQLAQLALTLAIAKRPKPLILDEPLASLDPMARRESLQAAYPENLPKRHRAPDHTHP